MDTIKVMIYAHDKNEKDMQLLKKIYKYLNTTFNDYMNKHRKDEVVSLNDVYDELRKDPNFEEPNYLEQNGKEYPIIDFSEKCEDNDIKLNFN